MITALAQRVRGDLHDLTYTPPTKTWRPRLVKYEPLEGSREYWDQIDRVTKRSGVFSKYSPDQPRDADGRFGSGGGGGGSSKPDPLSAFPPEQRDAMREMQERMTNDHPWDPAMALGIPDTLPQRDIAAYLKANGRSWESQLLPEGIKMGPQKECYANASRLIMGNPDLRYCEGFVRDPEVPGFAFLHGWAVDQSGKVVDNTLPHPEQNSYYGVVYDSDKYMAHMASTGMFGVLGGDEKDAKAVIARGGL